MEIIIKIIISSALSFEPVVYKSIIISSLSVVCCRLIMVIQFFLQITKLHRLASDAGIFLVRGWPGCECRCRWQLSWDFRVGHEVLIALILCHQIRFVLVAEILIYEFPNTVAVQRNYAKQEETAQQKSEHVEQSLMIQLVGWFYEREISIKTGQRNRIFR